MARSQSSQRVSYTQKVKAFVDKHPGLTRQQVIESFMKIGDHYGTIASALHRCVKKNEIIEDEGVLRLYTEKDNMDRVKNLLSNLSKAEQYKAGPRVFIDAKYAEEAKGLL